MCACAGCDLPAATSVVRSVQETPHAAAAGPWAGACHAQQNRLLVLLIIPYCLIVAWMWLPPLVFFLGFDSVHFLAETRLGRSAFIILGGQQLPSCFSSFFSHTVSFADSLLKHVLSLPSSNDVMFIIVRNKIYQGYLYHAFTCWLSEAGLNFRCAGLQWLQLAAWTLGSKALRVCDAENVGL